MTLGEFRKITEHYADECEIATATSYSNLGYAQNVERVVIDIAKISDEISEPKPLIVVI